MNKETCWITNRGTTTNNQWNNDDSDTLWTLYSVYKKLGQSSFLPYLLTCLNTLTYLKILCMHTIPLIKL